MIASWSFIVNIWNVKNGECCMIDQCSSSSEQVTRLRTECLYRWDILRRSLSSFLNKWTYINIVNARDLLLVPVSCIDIIWSNRVVSPSWQGPKPKLLRSVALNWKRDSSEHKPNWQCSFRGTAVTSVDFVSHWGFIPQKGLQQTNDAFSLHKGEFTF